MRFVKQRDCYSCGPVGIINALKWAGLPVSYQKHFHKIKKVCKTNRSWGTPVDRMTVALNEYQEHVRYRNEKRVTFRMLRRHLQTGGSAIFEYWFREDDGSYEGHYAFVYMENSEFVVVNDMIGGTKEVVSADYLKARLRCKKFRSSGSPSAWLLERVKES